jgi:predicted nicotinamide N-methyase
VKQPDPAAFIRQNTELLRPPLVPEIVLHLASEIVPIWKATEEALAEQGVPPPFWAFAWAGGQALARYVLDNPAIVRGRSVLDFGAGSGLAGIAAVLADAACVTCADIDAFAVAAVGLNAAANGVHIAATDEDLIGTDRGWDTVLIADMCYERELSARVEEWTRALARRGALVLIGDPRRTYFPEAGVEMLAEYEVATTRELEDREIRRTGVWRVVVSS